MGAQWARMTGKRRERLELRTIVVSTRAAVRHAGEPEQRERLKQIAADMLARLEQRVTGDGEGTEILAEIEAARRELLDEL